MLCFPVVFLISFVSFLFVWCFSDDFFVSNQSWPSFGPARSMAHAVFERKNNSQKPEQSLFVFVFFFWGGKPLKKLIFFWWCGFSGVLVEFDGVLLGLPGFASQVIFYVGVLLEGLLGLI